MFQKNKFCIIGSSKSSSIQRKKQFKLYSLNKDYMKKPLIIGNKIYKYKKDAILHYRKILNSYNFGQSLNENDFNDLTDLLLQEDDDIENSELNLVEDDVKKAIFTFNKTHFLPDETNVFEEESNRYIKCPTSKSKVVNYQNVEQLSLDIKIFKNERYFCIVDGNFIFGDFIEAFLVCRNMGVKELTISTLSLSQDNVDSLSNLLTGNFVEKLNLIVSDHFFTYERDNLVKYIYKNLDVNNKFQLSVCNNKSRIILIHSDDNGGRKYVIHGSANLDSSNFIEQFSIEENEELFDFNKSILDEIIEKFKTINKSFTEIKHTDNIEKKFLDRRPSLDDFSEKELEIVDIKVSKVQFSTKCFEVFYSDKTSCYISYLMRLNKTKYTPEKLFYIACRNSIHDDIKSVKQKYFDQNSVKGQVKCQETGVLSKWTELAVDHRQPNTFSIIVDRFKEINRIDLETIEYTDTQQNHIVFKNNIYTENFKQYHKEKASLRIVRNECNSSRTGMARLKRTSKDLTIR